MQSKYPRERKRKSRGRWLPEPQEHPSWLQPHVSTASLYSAEPPAGFTLLEMSLVVAIVAAVLAMTVSMGDSMVESARKVNTWNKMDEIEAALEAFRLANNRLPCPADATITDTPANATTYGVEASTLGDCFSTGTIKANYSANSTNNSNIPGSSTVAEGAVPVRTLNLPDDFQLDGWGRKLGYAVWTPFTNIESFLTYGLLPNCGGITVQNAGHGYRSTAAAYALISYGANGHGGYTKNGTRYFMKSDNADEWTDCHCNATADTGYKATYVEETPTQTSSADSLSAYDDYVQFKERWQMMDAYDTYHPTGAACTTGFEIDGNAGDQLSGPGFHDNGNGRAEVAIGDVNGDGYKDLIIGAPSANGNVGAVYVIFGGPTGISPTPFAISSLNGNNGFKINGDGTSTGEYFGTSVATGDINGDGIQDVIVTTTGFCQNDSYAYIIFGGKSSWNASYTMPSSTGSGLIDGTKGFRLTVPTGHCYDSIYASAGDINGDGYDDVFIGWPWSSLGPGGNESGSVYVVFGWPKGGSYTTHWPYSGQTISSLMDGTNGFRIDGYSLDAPTAGASGGIGLAGSMLAGNVSGQTGVKDLVLANGHWDTVASGTDIGDLYVIFGQKKGAAYSSAWPYTHADTTPGGTVINGTNGFQLTGGTPSAIYEHNFAENIAVGDVNNDGIADIVIGNYFTWWYVLDTIVVWGKTGSWSQTIPMYSYDDNGAGYHFFDNGTNGVVLTTTTNVYNSFPLVADINGDGTGDIVFGLNGNTTWVMYGTASGWSSAPWPRFTWSPSATPATPFDGTNGFKIGGGSAVAAGDITGDGKAELFFSNPSANSNAGAVYGVYGKKLNDWSNSQALSTLDH